MTENEWWSRYIKPRWHNLEKGWVARKVQDVTNKGAPDVDICWKGECLKVELKYAPKEPARLDTKLTFSRYSKDEPNKRTILSREQARNLAEWTQAGGSGYVLIGVNKRWYMITSVYFTNAHHYNDGLTLAEMIIAATFWGDDIKTIGSVPEVMQHG